MTAREECVGGARWIKIDVLERHYHSLIMPHTTWTRRESCRPLILPSLHYCDRRFTITTKGGFESDESMGDTTKSSVSQNQKEVVVSLETLLPIAGQHQAVARPGKH